MEIFYAALCGLTLSPWISACAQGDWADVQSQFHQCPRLLESCGPLGYTALHYAAEQGNNEACCFLLQRGASLLIPDALGEYPPYKAMRQGAANTAAFLDSYARQQAVVPWGKIDWLSANLWKSSLWFEACERGDWASVKVLFEQGHDMTVKGPNEYTALHYAAEQGNNEICRLLIKYGADPQAEDICGETPLHKAAEMGYKETFELLEAPVKNLPEGVLHSAVIGGHKGMVEFLLKAGLNVDSLDEGGYTPLGAAVSYGHQNIAALLLEWGADIHALHGNDPLVYGAITNPPLLEFLLQRGADIHQLNQDGESLLYAAARQGRKESIEIFERLIGMGLSPNTRNSAGHSLLHCAVIYSSIKFVEYLVKKVGISVNLKDNEGHTALQHLHLYRYRPDIEEYLEYLERLCLC